MKVLELIKQLKTMPKDSNVLHLWDGEARTGIELVWLSRDGDVITSDYEMVCYSEGTRPKDSPTEEEDKNWETKQGGSDEETREE